MKQALTIAGSDSGGGAGIQADLKTFHAHGVFGASVITAVTAQNTVAVTRAFELPQDLIRAQIDSVLDDLEIDAAKTGMLYSAGIVETIAAALSERNLTRLVVDPVMVSKSGYKLLQDAAIESLKGKLLPLAKVATPNIHEAEILAGMRIGSTDQMKAAARKIHEFGCTNVVVKGGHSDFDPATDVLFDGSEFHLFRSRFIEAKNGHGTGCTFSAAITARLALGESVFEAVAKAKVYTSHAIESAPDIGKGSGPPNHFYFLKEGACLEE